MKWAAAVCSAFAILAAPSAQAGLIAISAADGNLYSMSESDAQLTLIGNTGIYTWSDLAFAPDGALYGVTSGAGAGLYAIDPGTGSATLRGSLGLGNVWEASLAITPGGTAYATSADNSTKSAFKLFTVNLVSGAATLVNAVSGGGQDIIGLAYRDDGQLVALDGASGGGPGAFLLINPVTAAALSLSPVDVSINGGLTLVGNGGYLVSGSGGYVPELRSFNTVTGESAFIGTYAGYGIVSGLGLSGIALAPVPEPASLLMMMAGLGLIGVGVARRAALRGGRSTVCKDIYAVVWKRGRRK